MQLCPRSVLWLSLFLTALVLCCCLVCLLLAVLSSWVESLKGYASDPLSRAFPTISNDQSGARSYPKGATEVNARTIKPKVKNFDKKMRIVGIPGFNAFGTPSSKQPDIDF